MAHLLTSNANFIPGSPKAMLFDSERSALNWDMEQLNDVVEAIGHDGVELFDSRLFAHSRELNHAPSQQAKILGRTISSVHESWVGTADPQPRNAELARPPIKPGLAISIGSRVFFRAGPQSLDRLEALEQKLGRELDYVLFPDVHGNTDADTEKTKRFPRSGIQPTIDVAAAWGVDSPESFADQLEERGFMAVWDHFHGDRKGKVVQGEMRQDEYLPVLLKRGLVRAVHLGLYRHDFKKFDPKRYADSVYEGAALTNDGEVGRYPVGELFDMLREYGWQGNVTIEAPLSGIEAALASISNHPRTISRQEMIERYASIGRAVRTKLPHIAWHPVAS